MFALAFGQPLRGGLTLSCRPQPLLNTRLHGEDRSPGHEMTCRRAFLHAIYQERKDFLLLFLNFFVVQLKLLRNMPQQRMIVEFTLFDLPVLW